MFAQLTGKDKSEIDNWPDSTDMTHKTSYFKSIRMTACGNDYYNRKHKTEEKFGV